MKEINLGNKKFLVISLMQTLSEDTEGYPGDPKIEKEVFSKFSDTGYEHYVYKIGDHTFHPHADAPKHQNENSEGIEIFGEEFCFNECFLIDLAESGNVFEVRKEDLETFEDLLGKKGAVVIRTGYDKVIEANEKHDPKKIPYLTKEAAEYLASFDNLKVVGIDSLTIDPDACHNAHKILKDKMIVEGLVRLNNIKKKEFLLQTSPLRIKGATGAGIIAYAFVNVDENL